MTSEILEIVEIDHQAYVITAEVLSTQELYTVFRIGTDIGESPYYATIMISNDQAVLAESDTSEDELLRTVAASIKSSILDANNGIDQFL